MPGPTGVRLDDGFSSILTFSLDTTIALYEKQSQPFGTEGGDPIHTSTMRNVSLETFWPRRLKTSTRGTLKCAYDEGMLVRIDAMVNQNQQITFTFPTGRPWTFWGYVKSFIPDPLVMHQQPEATVEIVPTNVNNSKVETPPTMGTTTSTTTTTTTTT